MMAANNAYWQPFATADLIDASPNLLLTQPAPSTSQPLPPPQHPNLPHPPQPQPQPHSQQPWTNDFNRKKWSQDFGDFDINAAQTANRFFQMDEYQSNHDPSEADSPDSGSGSSNHRRNDSYTTSDTNALSQGDQKQRRKEQNRAAQRAFRERKERYVKELQMKIKDMEKKHSEELKRVNDENERLKDLVKKMEIEIYTLKGAAMAFNVSINKLREAGLDVGHPTPPSSHTPTTPPHHHTLADGRPTPPVPRSSSGTTSTTSTFEQFLPDSSSSSTFSNHFNTSPLSSRQQAQPQQQRTTDRTQAMLTDDNMMMGEIEDNNRDDEENDSFAKREASNFKHQHQLDGNHFSPSAASMAAGVKMIPCSQIWERLSQHPNFDEFDLDKLCEELKKKAKCSGNGPVIPEFELEEVLRRMDSRTI